MHATWMHLVVPSASAVGFWQERTLLYMKKTNNKFVTSDMCTCDLNVTNMDLILIIIILIIENKGRVASEIYTAAPELMLVDIVVVDVAIPLDAMQ